MKRKSRLVRCCSLRLHTAVARVWTVVDRGLLVALARFWVWWLSVRDRAVSQCQTRWVCSDSSGASNAKEVKRACSCASR